MANPNFITTTAIYGKTDIMPNVPLPPSAAITTNPAGSGFVFKVNCLTVMNTDGTKDIDLSVGIVRQVGGLIVIAFIAKAIVVPQDASLLIIGKDNPVYLNEGDSLHLEAGTANSIDAVCSYEVIS